MDSLYSGRVVGTVVLGGALLVFIRNVINGPRSAGTDGPSAAVVEARKGVVFKGITAVLRTLDDCVWLVTGKWIGYLLHDANTMNSLPKPGEEGVRCQDPSKPLQTTCEGQSTLLEILQFATTQYANKPAFGTRTYLGETEPEGPKKLTKKIFGETTWRTYKEVGERAFAFGAALRKIGVVPFQGTPKEYEKAALGKHCMMIYENTCDDWTTAFLGAMTQSVVVSTSYATLGLPAMLESMEETGACVLLCNRSDVSKVLEGAKSKFFTTIVYTNNYIAPDEAAKPLPKQQGGITIYSMDEFVALGKANPIEPTPPTPSTLAVIMFTSGSTGKPKGVMLTHECTTAAAGGGVNRLAGSGFFKMGEEVYLAYLPAAHILELTVEVIIIAMGGQLGFADPRSIASTGAVRQRPDGTINDKPNLKFAPGAIQEFRPTVMAGVPKVWDVLKSGALAKIGAMPPLVQAVIGEMVACRDHALRVGTDTPVFGFVFGAVLGKMVGGRLRGCVSGGGPLSAGTQTWVRCALCKTFVQGYGLTETNGATCVQNLYQVKDGIAGAPLSSVELKLHSVTDVQDTMGKPYLATDTEHVVSKQDGQVTIPCLGRGELWIRGGTVAKGYFKLPDKTKSEFTDDGWFKTGDICLWTTDGSIKIVDRLKNLVKLRGGEYVAIENMEKEYGQSVYVNAINGGVMVVADGDMDRAVVVAQANMVEIEKLAKELGVSGSAVELCRNKEIEKAVLADMVGKAMKTLSPLEKVVAVRLLPGTDANNAPISETAPWTVENGGLLASNKLGRKAIQKELGALVEEVRQKGIR